TAGGVPAHLTERVDAHRLCMQGTYAPPNRCVALDAEIGGYSRCSIHPNRHSVCRELDASGEFGAARSKCYLSRHAHGLPPLTAADWRWREADNDVDHPDDSGNSPSSPPGTPIAA